MRPAERLREEQQNSAVLKRNVTLNSSNNTEVLKMTCSRSRDLLCSELCVHKHTHTHARACKHAHKCAANGFTTVNLRIDPRLISGILDSELNARH